MPGLETRRDKHMQNPLLQQIDAIAKEKGVEPEVIITAVQDAIEAAARKRYKNEFGGVDHAVSELVISRQGWLLPIWRFRRSVLRNGPRAVGWLKRKLRRTPITNDGDED